MWSAIISIKETSENNLSCLLQTCCCLSTIEKLFITIFKTCGVINYGCGWRKDVNQCLACTQNLHPGLQTWTSFPVAVALGLSLLLGIIINDFCLCHRHDHYHCNTTGHGLEGSGQRTAWRVHDQGGIGANLHVLVPRQCHTATGWWRGDCLLSYGSVRAFCVDLNVPRRYL